MYSAKCLKKEERAREAREEKERQKRDEKEQRAEKMKGGIS